LQNLTKSGIFIIRAVDEKVKNIIELRRQGYDMIKFKINEGKINKEVIGNA